MKSGFIAYDLETAPQGSLEGLRFLNERYKMIPNVAKVVAESPLAVNTVARLAGSIDKESTFSPLELQVVYLSVSRERKCSYCVAAHSAMCQMNGLDVETIESLSVGGSVADKRLQVLSAFAGKLAAKEGNVTEEEIGVFLQAGYSRAQIFEILVAMALKTITNFSNHLVETPIDEAFLPWVRPAKGALVV